MKYIIQHTQQWHTKPQREKFSLEKFIPHPRHKQAVSWGRTWSLILLTQKSTIFLYSFPPVITGVGESVDAEILHFSDNEHREKEGAITLGSVNLPVETSWIPSLRPQPSYPQPNSFLNHPKTLYVQAPCLPFSLITHGSKHLRTHFLSGNFPHLECPCSSLL